MVKHIYHIIFSCTCLPLLQTGKTEIHLIWEPDTVNLIF